jgi:hypothetical protein
MSAYYDVARICLNGHLIGFESKGPGRPGLRRVDPFCQQCGSRTIAECPVCRSEIRGRPMVSPMVPDVFTSYDVPPFCRACGSAYPWTKSKIEPAKEPIRLADELNDAEKATLTADLPDLVSDTPRTQAAATRFKRLLAKLALSTDRYYKLLNAATWFKRLLAKLGGWAKSTLPDILRVVASEAAKKVIKVIFGP